MAVRDRSRWHICSCLHVHCMHENHKGRCLGTNCSCSAFKRPSGYKRAVKKLG